MEIRRRVRRIGFLIGGLLCFKWVVVAHYKYWHISGSQRDKLAVDLL